MYNLPSVCMRSEGYSNSLVCVCPSVCLSGHAILVVHVRAIKSIMKDTIVLSVRSAAIFIFKLHFSLNCLIRKLEHFYLHVPRQGQPFFS